MCAVGIIACSLLPRQRGSSILLPSGLYDLCLFSSLQLLAFLQGLFTFYHHGYELAKDFGDFKTQLTISIQNVSGGRGRRRKQERVCLLQLPLLYWHEVCAVESWLGSEDSGDLMFLE